MEGVTIFFITKTNKNQSINFTNIGAAKMYCEVLMYMENSFTKAFKK